MIPRQGLDIGWSDLRFALRECLRSNASEPIRRRLEAAWSPGRETVACLSARSGFDALLGVLNWPPGSEVLVSAATIRDMPRLLVAHGLVPIPVDVNFQTLAVDSDRLLEAITPRTKAILVAHLFGSRMPMSAIIDIARQRQLLVIEDCAQAFAADGYRGHDDADASMFSFGPIKTATALGGGMLRFRDAELGRRVREHMRQWPAQSNRAFLARVAKYSLLAMLSARAVFTCWTGVLRRLGIDYDALISRSIRGFAGTDFLGKFRRQPSAAMLSLLERRLSGYPRQRIDNRRRFARQAVELLPYAAIPGQADSNHTFWVFPILCDDPEALRQHLIACGFDATRGASSMGAVGPPDVSRPRASQVERELPRLLYLPVSPEMSAAELERLAEAVAGFAAQPVTGQETPQAQEASLLGQESKDAAA